MRDNKKLYRTISIVSLLVMLIAILMLIWIFLRISKSHQQYRDLSQIVSLDRKDDAAQVQADPTAAADEDALIPGEQPAAEEAPLPSEEPSDAEIAPQEEIPIDFAYLHEVNEDIIAWIRVDGTTVDYPILYDQTKERFYLNHNYSGAYTMAGSIFMQGENSKDFDDFNTVIYGHNLIDRRMFGCLHDFEQKDFFDEHDSIVIYTPDRVLRYRIFAAYRTDKQNLLTMFSYETEEDRQAYVDRIFTHEVRALFRPEAAPTPDDRIVTLSTCIGNPAYRYLVQGKLIEELPGSFEPQN
ncbi:MAG: class B sortase [Lachnospiraceae bacterium]|nr:class B sortase [Lachnospiraceae bacterium]